ncbi:LacI family DNA-binding transcriptional regulator [Rarobacter incanus]|uniref:LacI family transcriptional regulator n=1 Tax=Rarobacter incanus TaxID=153494 RepID=A0A542SNS0_9MICO|nr:LacI family DNA-binding transcriptional regulator [Rarobacter incanus]TQK76263.1 LacI family transcriptional regulator [Rarobacter incanus]
MEQRPPTLDEVAIAAGVSRSTASRVINGAARVSPATKRAVEYAIERLGYVPNHAARFLVMRKTGFIVLITDQVSRPTHRDIIKSVIDVCDAAGLSVVLKPASAEPERIERLRRTLRPGFADGVIVASAGVDANTVGVVLDSGLPSVFIGRPAVAGRVPTYAGVDFDEVVRLGLAQFAARGATRPLLIAGPTSDLAEPWARLSAAQGIDALRVDATGLGIDAGCTAIRKARAQGAAFDAVLTENGPLAVGALLELGATPPAGADAQSRHARIPVVAFGAADFTRVPASNLAVVVHPAADIARLAATMLVAQLDKDAQPACESDEPGSATHLVTPWIGDQAV